MRQAARMRQSRVALYCMQADTLRQRECLETGPTKTALCSGATLSGSQKRYILFKGLCLLNVHFSLMEDYFNLLTCADDIKIVALEEELHPKAAKIKLAKLIVGSYFDKKIAEETGLPVHVADDPLTAVVLGTGQTLNMSSRLRRRLVVSTKLDF